MRHDGRDRLRLERRTSALRVRVNGRLVNDSYVVVDAPVSGYGIAYVPKTSWKSAQGSLAQVLDDWSPFFDGYFLYCPSRRQNLPAFQLVVDALRHRDQPKRR